MVATESETAEGRRPTVVFFPWVVLESSFLPEGIEFRHYNREDSTLPDDIRHILNCYERCADQKIEVATLLAYNGEVGGILTDAQVESAFSLREAASFAALRKREFFGGSNYCNDHTFSCVAQAYVPGKPGATAISRRRDGRALRGLGEEYHRVICPYHVSAESRITLDSALLRALVCAMADPKCDWVRDGIELFNLANGDSPQIPGHTEILLTVAATQRLLGMQSRSDAGELSQRFAEVLYGAAPALLNVDDCSRIRNGKQPSLAQAWFYDFYSDRNVVAHGRPRPLGNRLWSRDEHLLLASYIVPRVALIRLAAARHYAVTEGDVEELASFEYLLCLNDVFGPGDIGSQTGLPGRLRPATGRHAWSAALWTAEREQRLQRFFREHGIQEQPGENSVS